MGRCKENEYISMVKAAPLVHEISGVSRSHWSLEKWSRGGRIASNGEIVKLKVSRRLGRLYTTRKWLEEFIRKIG